VNELLEVLKDCDKEDKDFIQDELFSEIKRLKSNLYANYPQWYRVRWGHEQARSEEHFNECRNIWIDKLKDGTLYKEIPIKQN